MIKYYCNRCEKELSVDDGIIVKMKLKAFRSPLPVKMRFHLCQGCIDKLEKFINSYDGKGRTEE